MPNGNAPPNHPGTSTNSIHFDPADPRQILETSCGKGHLPPPMAAPVNQPSCQTRTEIVRAAKLCAPGIDTVGNLTFNGHPENAADVTRWRDTVFLPLLGPLVTEATLAARQGCRELLRVDAALDKRLAGPLAKASRSAGHVIASALHAPSSEAILKKFLAAVTSGSTPGHMAVVLAARASIFHFPARTVAGALVLLEMRYAPVDTVWTAIEACLDSLPPAESSLRAA